jgi:hypothetical protein
MRVAVAWVRPGILAMLMLAAGGCEERIYEIDLRPHGDRIERRLTVKRRDLRDQKPKCLVADDRPEVDDRRELERIARAYQTKAPSLPRREASFSGAFGGTLPRDVGGDGHYVHYESPLGHVRVYVERFRGDDDIYSSLEARRKAVDQLVDLLVGWFGSELSGQPDWPRLRTFLDQQFRTDLQNLSLFVWSTNVRNIFESTDSLAEVAVRAAQYLVERNYFSYDELPTLRRELGDAWDRGRPTALWDHIRRLIAARAGGSEASWKQSLGFLSDETAMETSWHRFFWQSPYFKEHVADIKREHREVRGSTSNGPDTKSIISPKFVEEKEGDLLRDLLGTAFAFSPHFLSDASRVQATLRVPRKPFWTNGKWNEKEQRVEWSPLIAERLTPNREKAPLAFEWPTLCYAAWDEPDDGQQKQIFGQTGLTGPQLLDYCLWYQGLTGSEKKEWDAFLPTLKDNQPASRLKAFRFSNEPPDGKSDERVASEVRGTLTNVFYPEKRNTVESGGEVQPAPLPPGR